MFRHASMIRFLQHPARFLCVALCALCAAGAAYAGEPRGHLQINGEPGVAVFLNDEYKGTTNAAHSGLILPNIPGGSHRLRLSREGFQPQEAVIEISPNRVLEFSIRPFVPQLEIAQRGREDTRQVVQESGNLLIQSLPVACVINIPALGLADEKKTRDEWEASGVPVGTYPATFRALGQTIEYDVTIESDRTTHLFFDFIESTVRDVGLEKRKAAEASRRAEAKRQLAEEAAARIEKEIAEYTERLRRVSRWHFIESQQHGSTSVQSESRAVGVWRDRHNFYRVNTNGRELRRTAETTFTDLFGRTHRLAIRFYVDIKAQYDPTRGGVNLKGWGRSPPYAFGSWRYEWIIRHNGEERRIQRSYSEENIGRSVERFELDFPGFQLQLVDPRKAFSRSTTIDSAGFSMRLQLPGGGIEKAVARRRAELEKERR